MTDPLVLNHIQFSTVSSNPKLHWRTKNGCTLYSARRQHPLARRRQIFEISIQEAPGSRHFTRSDRFRTARTVRVAQILLVVSHHADEGSIDGRSAEEHEMVGYRDAGLTWCGEFVSALGGRVWKKKGGKQSVILGSSYPIVVETFRREEEQPLLHE